MVHILWIQDWQTWCAPSFTSTCLEWDSTTLVSPICHQIYPVWYLFTDTCSILTSMLLVYSRARVPHFFFLIFLILLWATGKFVVFHCRPVIENNTIVLLVAITERSRLRILQGQKLCCPEETRPPKLGNHSRGGKLIREETSASERGLFYGWRMDIFRSENIKTINGKKTR